MSDSIQQFRSYLESSKSVAILTRENPTVDGVASALSLYLALSAAGKQVTVACASPMTVEFNRLVGVDKITTGLNGNSGRNLVISFPYEEGSIEKVSYNIDNDAFNLVIEPREEYPTVTPEMIRYSYNGGTVDLLILVDTPNLTDLGALYQGNISMFSEKTIVNIDTNPQNASFAKVNLVDPGVSSISELILTILSQLGATTDGDIATNLLYGISTRTNNFTSTSTNASTFEAASQLMKLGAQKPQAPFTPTSSPAFPKPSELNRPQPSVPNSFPKPMRPSNPPPRPMNTQPPQRQPYNQPQRPAPAMRRPGNFNPPSFPQTQPQRPANSPFRPPSIPAAPAKPQAAKAAPQPPQPQAPPDWLKPKIYKGSTLV